MINEGSRVQLKQDNDGRGPGTVIGFFSEGLARVKWDRAVSDDDQGSDNDYITLENVTDLELVGAA